MCLNSYFKAKWRFKSLTYSMNNYPSWSYNLQSRDSVDYYIAKSFKV